MEVMEAMEVREVREDREPERRGSHLHCLLYLPRDPHGIQAAKERRLNEPWMAGLVLYVVTSGIEI